MPTCSVDGCTTEVKTKNSAGHYREIAKTIAVADNVISWLKATPAKE